MTPRKSMEPCTNSPGSEVFYQELSEEETCKAYHGEAAGVHLNVVHTLEVTSTQRQRVKAKVSRTAIRLSY